MSEQSGKILKADSVTSLFRYADGVIPNTLAIIYAVVGYMAGLLLLCQTGAFFMLGILLLAHSLVIASYLIHECTHSTLFAPVNDGQTDLNLKLGTLLSWLTGACYGELARIKDKHMRHHFERADIVAVDYRKLLLCYPMLGKSVELGQKCCLPAVELLMHMLVIIRPFSKQGSLTERQRVISFGLLRLFYFALLAYWGGWPLLLGYGIAYLIFLTVLGFMDAFQHEYLLLEGLDESRGQSPTRDTNRFPTGYFSREYENAHTFSNLFSSRFPLLNLLVLNFCYHNIHHQKPMEPWYRLPALHHQIIKDQSGKVQVVPLASQLRDFFRYRVERVMAPATDRFDGRPNLGAAGVSFLTPL